MIDINTPECRTLVIYQPHLSIKQRVLLKVKIMEISRLASNAITPLFGHLSRIPFQSMIQSQEHSAKILSEVINSRNKIIYFEPVFSEAFKSLEVLNRRLISQMLPAIESYQELFNNSLSWWVDENKRINKIVANAIKLKSFNLEVWTRYRDQTTVFEQGFKVNIKKEEEPLNLKDYNIKASVKSIEVDGVKYRLALIPEDHTKINFNEADTVESILMEKANLNLGVKLNDLKDNSEIKKKRKGRFIYNLKERMVNVGQYSCKINYSKSIDIIDNFLTFISNDKYNNRWNFGDLLDNFDREEFAIENKDFESLRAIFNRIKNNLPEEIKDLFKVGRKYIELNIKYR